ncbi:MAG TPA: MFS transporter, partial [Chromatiaceae bacterium]|nr:MFS transporter [Chromatiaceae bacterium]
MLGLFLILPVFALYAEHLAGTTPLLVGIAIGAYGLTQAILQIPFGMLSDHIGRKPVIVAGLLLFALGSVIAARADSIWGVILGRAIQGSGAVAAAIMALAADLTREEHRTKVMAMIGMSIGMAFALALVLGPILNDHIGVPGIFWVTAGLAVAGILIILFAVPTPPRSSLHRDAEAVPALLARVFRDGQLLRLDFGIFTLHMMLTSVFLALPLSLRDAGLAEARHWLLYLPVLIGSMLLMIPFVIAAEKYGRMKSVFLFAVALLALASIIFWQGAHALWALTLGLVVFFTAFNILEATLPSLVSR